MEEVKYYAVIKTCIGDQFYQLYESTNTMLFVVENVEDATPFYDKEDIKRLIGQKFANGRMFEPYKILTIETKVDYEYYP